MESVLLFVLALLVAHRVIRGKTPPSLNCDVLAETGMMVLLWPGELCCEEQMKAEAAQVTPFWYSANVGQ